MGTRELPVKINLTQTDYLLWEVSYHKNQGRSQKRMLINGFEKNNNKKHVDCNMRNISCDSFMPLNKYLYSNYGSSSFTPFVISG